MYKTTLSGQVWRFDSLKTLMAKASPARSGDALAGIIATSAEERMAAKMALAEVPLTDILDNPLMKRRTKTKDSFHGNTSRYGA